MGKSITEERFDGEAKAVKQCAQAACAGSVRRQCEEGSMRQGTCVLGSASSQIDEAIASISNGLRALKQDEAFLIPWIAQTMASKSIAPTILEFATAGTASCSGGRSCARLYLALQGMAIPLGDTAIGLDSTRSTWWLRAVFEGMTGIWAGNEVGVKLVAAAQPLIWEQAQAATRAWEKTEWEQNVRFRSSCNDPTEM